MRKKAVTLLEEAINAGKKRDYDTSIAILEDLLARGFAAGKKNPYHQNESFTEILLYLWRAWNAKKNVSKALFYARAYTMRCPDDAQGWFFLGRAFFRAEHFDRAAAAFERSVSLDGSIGVVHVFLGFSYLKARRVESAQHVFEQALARFPNEKRLQSGYLNALFVQAVRQYRNGDVDLARQMFSFIIESGIDGVAPQLYLAHSLRALGNLPEAFAHYMVAMQLAPEDTALKWYAAELLQQMGDLKGASALLSEAGVSLNNELSDEFLAFGAIKTHFENNNWYGVINAARLYIKHYGATVQAHLFLAEAQRNVGRIQNAVNHYRRALEIEADNEHAYYGLVDTLEKAYRWKELEHLLATIEKAGCWDDETVYYHKVLTAAHADNAPEDVLPHLQALVQRSSPDPLLYAALGRCYVALDLADLAEGWYVKATELDPHNEEAALGLLVCYEHQAKDKALYAHYVSYLNRWQDNTPIYEDFISFLQESERWEEAADRLEILAQLTQQNRSPDIALARRKAGQYAQAAILYRNMLRQKPEERILLHNLVYCLDKMGQSKSALNLLKLSRDTFGEHRDTMLIEGILLLRARRYDDAIRVLQYIAEKNPKDKEIRKFLDRALKKK